MSYIANETVLSELPLTKGYMTKKVLVVDDEADLTELLSELLESEGLEVFVANNGNDAFDLALAHRPDVIFSDFKMPGVNGLELCAQLKQHPETYRIPFVLISGSPPVQQPETVYATMLKPVHLVRLMSVINKLPI
jgi:CheY-like chemotaxis protein